MSFVVESGYTREMAKESVGKGWSTLLDKVFDQLPEETTVVQVKEKFGGLRIYMDNYTAPFDTIVRDAENQSFEICEYCGSTEEISVGPLPASGYWIKTLCAKCRTRLVHGPDDAS